MASKKPAGSIIGSTGKRAADGDGDGEKRQKLSFGISKPTKPAIGKPTGLQIKLNTVKSTNVKPMISKTSVFDDESDEEPEEMPPEARMRMRNIGRDTPTSAGPNSFGKTKHGFCNIKKVYEKNMAADADTLAVGEDSKESEKTG